MYLISDVGCWADGAHGHQHIRDTMADMLRQSEMIQRLTDVVNNDVRWLRRSEPSSATHCFPTDSETSACGLMTMGGVGEWSETEQNEVVWCDLCRRRLSKKCSTAFNSAESRGER